MKNVTQLIKDGLKNTTIYPSVGNHDYFPANIVKFYKPRDNELFNGWAYNWADFINDQEQLNLFYDWGYYSLNLTRFDGK